MECLREAFVTGFYFLNKESPGRINLRDIANGIKLAIKDTYHGFAANHNVLSVIFLHQLRLVGSIVVEFALEGWLWHNQELKLFTHSFQERTTMRGTR